MIDPTIACPACATEIRLTESLAGPLLAEVRRDYEARLKSERDGIAEREAALSAAQADLAAELEAKLAAARRDLAAEEAAKARQASAAELADLQAALTEREAKLATAQAAQADFLRRSRELADAKRELELTVEQRVGAELEAARDRAKAEAEAGLRLKVAEKEATISGMQKQIEDLRRRAEQGSQQLQGEVLEIDMENRLKARFPQDVIEPVAKGVSGADVVQRVIGPGGETCGAILWESKRTKAWSDGWIAKLKADQRAIGADVALLISEALPRDVDSFDHADGVWIASPRCAIPLAIAVRHALIGVSAARTAQAGQATKMELVYAYLTGPRFRHRVEAIVERFGEMSEDLERERKAMTRLWAKREAQINCVVEATVGMYGDLQGIAGKALEEIDGLALPLPDIDGPAPGRVVGTIPRRP